MKYFIVGLIIFIAVIIVFYFNNEIVKINNEIKKTCFQDNCFNVEISDNDDERSKGLMLRENLCENCGMLFVFEKEGNYIKGFYYHDPEDEQEPGENKFLDVDTFKRYWRKFAIFID